jgi:hypothetical protein
MTRFSRWRYVLLLISFLHPLDDSLQLATPHVYPPSPSPSRSRSSRLPALRFQEGTSSRPTTHLQPSTSEPPSTEQRPLKSSSHVETSRHPHPTAPISPLGSAGFSPWSTDDESAWETASATTSTSTTSASFPNDTFTNSYQHPSQPHGHARLPIISHDDRQGLEDAEGLLDLDLDVSQEHLPHIPLRPFRNQVGGHSAIYKFTKQAVCKVCNIYHKTIHSSYPVHLSLLSRARISFTSPWNERPLHSWDIFPAI